MTDDDIQTMTEDDIRHMRADYEAAVARNRIAAQRLREIADMLDPAMADVSETGAAIATGIYQGKIRAGHDFPCCLHKGPKGNCQPWNCRCY